MIPKGKLVRINFMTIQLLENIVIYPQGRDISENCVELLGVLNEQIQIIVALYEEKSDCMAHETALLWKAREACCSSDEAQYEVEHS